VSPLTSSGANLKVEFGAAYSTISAVPARYAVSIGIIVLAVALSPRPGNPKKRKDTTP
jgi:hypothetical protein